MWQTKYASAAPKNLGLGVNFWPFSEGYFFSGRPWSVQFWYQNIISLQNSFILFLFKCVYDLQYILLVLQPSAVQISIGTRYT